MPPITSRLFIMPTTMHLLSNYFSYYHVQEIRTRKRKPSCVHTKCSFFFPICFEAQSYSLKMSNSPVQKVHSIGTKILKNKSISEENPAYVSNATSGLAQMDSICSFLSKNEWMLPPMPDTG